MTVYRHGHILFATKEEAYDYIFKSIKCGHDMAKQCNDWAYEVSEILTRTKQEKKGIRHMAYFTYRGKRSHKIYTEYSSFLEMEI